MFRVEKAAGELPHQIASPARIILQNALELLERCWVNHGPREGAHEHCLQTAMECCAISADADDHVRAQVALLWAINRDVRGIRYTTLPSFNDTQRSFGPVRSAILHAMEIVDSITDNDCALFGYRSLGYGPLGHSHVMIFSDHRVYERKQMLDHIGRPKQMMPIELPPSWMVPIPAYLLPAQREYA